jgi:hypothetical protein
MVIKIGTLENPALDVTIIGRQNNSLTDILAILNTELDRYRGMKRAIMISNVIELVKQFKVPNMLNSKETEHMRNPFPGTLYFLKFLD